MPSKISIQSCCTKDIVVDTNVLKHAETTSVPQNQSSLEFVQWLVERVDIYLVLDDQGKVKPDLKTSVLVTEYRNTLAPQGLGLTLLTACLSSGRVKFSPRPSQEVRKILRKLVPRNTQDQAVLGAAHGSTDKLLVSNDFDDFPFTVRESVKKELLTSIFESDELEFKKNSS